MTSEVSAALQPVVALLCELEVPYHIGGSVASSAHGIMRTTLDVDIVADLRLGHVPALVDRLAAAYYIDGDAAADAIRHRSMFNLVHLDTMLRVDVYLLTGREFDRTSFARRVERSLEPESDRRFFFATAEDTVLHKLEWYEAGDRVSERQWGDVIGVLRVQAGALELAYLHRWAEELGVSELLERALTEAAS